MSTAAQVLTVFIGVGGFVLVLALVRKGYLKERFAAIWLFIGVGMILLALFRPLLDRLSESLGIQSGTTTLFVIAILVILGVLLQLSIAVSRGEDKMRDLAEAVALLSASRTDEPGSPVEPGDER
jgi:hypothetical protein